ncbi:MAG: 1-deoxy-D-xylulose-5-phosphate reductoisomerase [Deltaproteobacteria bacterium]|nr:1-deoxy-D-xylulose-5-phosphate reductoisomerase [Deltaproteobacteria bacterium]
MDKQFCVYILASKRNGTLYIGVTSELATRVWQHKSKVVEGFSAKSGVDKLVHYEAHGCAETAIVREKQLKKRRRAWKMTNCVPFGHGPRLHVTHRFVAHPRNSGRNYLRWPPRKLRAMASLLGNLGMKRLAILGSTGSIGVTTLDLVARFPERFRVEALAAGKNAVRLAQQVRRFEPRLVAVADDEAAAALRAAVPEFSGALHVGPAGLHRVATADGAELLVSALVGALGLEPTLAGIAAGKDVALANKEVLVVAGEVVTRAARDAGVRLLPLDSEHNAIFQALRGHQPSEVRRLVLTASGGPFRTHSRAQLHAVTREQALQHPTWKMGNKVTIDSATLMNKGLEVIEAHWLFDVPAEQIDVVIHPQSIVHSMVEYIDGSVIAQLGVSDMAIPISYVLAYPDRLPLAHLPRLDLARAGALTFEAPDLDRFPCLALAYRALGAGGTAAAVLNAANEVAVDGFLRGRLSFLAISQILTAVMDRHTVVPSADLAALLQADRWARAQAAGMTEASVERASA